MRTYISGAQTLYQKESCVRVLVFLILSFRVGKPLEFMLSQAGGPEYSTRTGSSNDHLPHAHSKGKPSMDMED